MKTLGIITEYNPFHQGHAYMLERAKRKADADRVVVIMSGSFVQRGGRYYITYRETEATGYDGCTTTVKLDKAGTVSMLRFGPAPSQLVIERGKRHVCHYDTGQGSLSLGVAADEIHSRLSEKGGRVRFSYMLDVDDASVSRNIVDITVKPTM